MSPVSGLRHRLDSVSPVNRKGYKVAGKVKHSVHPVTPSRRGKQGEGKSPLRPVLKTSPKSPLRTPKKVCWWEGVDSDLGSLSDSVSS
ncbi:MAG: hypothetical protein AAGM46_28185, partial [Cyanobacteria bacterium J06582_2]